MALAAPAGFTSSNLVYQESFSGTTLDSYWHNYITSRAANGWAWNSNGSGGSGPGGPYDADYDMPSQVTVNNGVLDLTAIRQNVTGMNQGTAQSFPITSGAVSSYGNLEFDGGYLQISMKAPSGDGAWPGLWLMPGAGASSGDNFEIDIQEGGYTGNGPANQAFTWHLHTPSGTVGGTVNTGIDLTAGFHIYGINWVPGQSITWYLDGRQIATVTSAQVPIPNEPMQLIMSNQVANSNAAGWHTALDSSTPSSMAMQIDEIQLYRAAGSGGSVTGANVTGSASTTTPTTPSQPATTSTSDTTATSIAAPTTVVTPAATSDPTSPSTAAVDPGTVTTTTVPSFLSAMGMASPSGWSASTTGASTGSWANQDFAQPSSLADTTRQTGSWSGNQGTAAASEPSNSFALLNQYLASSSGPNNGGSIAVAIAGADWTQNSFLTKPQS
ncbi:glycoside hydrolase family 16 protein [Bradyrhizobium tropiciagri]|uniref:glycoside hydrolase family 16 protein n=1 Tax=Bradyrhizobium tropiciagri TaxID=312253 RepID=UPI001BA9BFFE|nr:glycoside hydrolase family 16 protein [Bradyrhizobium tropiciagri]MBR0900663.1 glycoside hydrolase family 16 protein [Bradyrhizobium tropiciagri]